MVLAPLHSTCAASSKFGHEFRFNSREQYVPVLHKILIPPHILLCNASYAVGMLHGALHRFIALALLHLNSDTNLGYCPRLAETLNNSTAYIASQCFICRRHASWCYAPLHSNCAASSKFGHEFRLYSALHSKRA